MTVLSVNLNKVALIRNSRDTTSPSPTEFAALAIAAGAGGITVHPEARSAPYSCQRLP
jgi:pyridoxine 5-phosphate synthase